MSYCSFGTNSDVHVFKDATLFVFRCCGRKLIKGQPYGLALKDHVCFDEQEMIEHLLHHREVGHKVPEYAIKRLKDEKDKK